MASGRAHQASKRHAEFPGQQVPEIQHARLSISRQIVLQGHMSLGVCRSDAALSCCVDAFVCVWNRPSNAEGGRKKPLKLRAAVLGAKRLLGVSNQVKSDAASAAPSVSPIAPPAAAATELPEDQQGDQVGCGRTTCC